jgi:hypothetical protein
MSQNSNGNKNAGQWSQIIGQILEKLSGTNMSTTVGFEHLEVDIPRLADIDRGAVLMIEHIEKIGEIEQTEQYQMYRRRMLLPEKNS